MPVHQDGPRTRTLGLANAALLYIWAIMRKQAACLIQFNSSEMQKIIHTLPQENRTPYRGWVHIQHGSETLTKGTIAF